MLVRRCLKDAGDPQLCIMKYAESTERFNADHSV